MKIDWIEIHITHTCNLKCSSCLHFSNSDQYKDFVSLSEFEENLIALKQKITEFDIELGVLQLLGGEPLLNKDLYEYFKISRKYFKDIKISLVTNGILIPDFPDFFEMIEKYDILLIISNHLKNDHKDLAEEMKSKYNFEFWYFDFVDGWLKKYTGINENIKPLDGNNSKLAYDSCPHKCYQLLENKIYKCGLVCYYQLQKRKFPTINWKYFNEYKPLDLNTCDKNEFELFFNRKEEDICNHCSTEMIILKLK